MANQKKYSIIDRAVDTLDLPGDVLLNLPRITMTGGRQVLIENHKGLKDYGDKEIVVAGGRVAVKVTGTELELRAMNANALVITGTVFQVEFVY